LFFQRKEKEKNMVRLYIAYRYTDECKNNNMQIFGTYTDNNAAITRVRLEAEKYYNKQKPNFKDLHKVIHTLELINPNIFAITVCSDLYSKCQVFGVDESKLN